MNKIEMLIERVEGTEVTIFTIKLLDINNELLRLFFAVEVDKDDYAILNEFQDPIEETETEDLVNRLYERFNSLIKHRKTFGYLNMN